MAEFTDKMLREMGRDEEIPTVMVWLARDLLASRQRERRLERAAIEVRRIMTEECSALEWEPEIKMLNRALSRPGGRKERDRRKKA